MITSLINEKEDCIVKVGDKWRIKGNKVRYWNAEFDTKKAAQAALRAYWANKHESNQVFENEKYQFHHS